MGAAALCFAASPGRAFDAVILESLYHDLGSAFSSRIGQAYPAWFKRFSRGVVWVTEKRLALRLSQLAPVEHIGNLAPSPVLILTGTDDAYAPPEDAQRLYQSSRGPCELWLVSRAGHLDVCEAGGTAYREHILDFLQRRLAA
jgi:fermentation-respiration switch protein FrsA (DUF1100 family)